MELQADKIALHSNWLTPRPSHHFTNLEKLSPSYTTFHQFPKMQEFRIVQHILAMQ